ncbi:protein NO VEIN domain-containing protein [Streptomyces sp. NPDC002889]|uniref:protein NO VEIN domain-containing protein n=1 Tax=Streptomyces sp. NPDC002889 TaxID=3364669 RepID=UPI0036959DAF
MATPSPFMMVHVGQSTESQRNLQYGIETRSWGFPEEKPQYRYARPRFAVLATGASPRVQLESWLEETATLYLFEIRGDFYTGTAWHWPDEEAEQRIKYPCRFGIEPLAVLHDVPLGPDGPLTQAGSDAIRRSGTDRGMGKLVSMPALPLLQQAGIPVDPQQPEVVPLDKSPGFTADQVEGKKKPQRRRRGAGYISDPKKRTAIEKHAEDHAAAHYANQGWTVERLGKPYDLHCTRGTQERHVEVKGTTGAPTSVELTINEVLHARDKDNTVDLYVVSDIKVDTRTDPYTATGDTVTLYENWEPAEQDLRPRTYEYRLPTPAS